MSETSQLRSDGIFLKELIKEVYIMKETMKGKVKEARRYTRQRMEELIEIFSDASRRMALTEEQLKAAPTVEEAIEAIFGEVA